MAYNKAQTEIERERKTEREVYLHVFVNYIGIEEKHFERILNSIN